MSDPCECVFNHATMMRRLISLLQDAQSDCTDTECSSTVPGVDGSSSGNMMLIAMAWGLLAMFLFFMRPSSMRSNRDQTDGKPDSSGGSGAGPREEPPAPDVM